jgi:NADPH2:quinone reductase
LGMDLAGIIEAVGDNVTRFKAGDEVYGMAAGIGGHQGSQAEYAAAAADLLALKPTRLSFREAAALPLVAITAWEGLVDRAGIASGERVLIHGGAGGIGHVAVQLAKAFNADVYSTVKREQFSIVEGYGATPIDYQSESVADYLDRYTGGEGFDIVYDTVGGASLDASFQVVKTYTGHVVSALGWGTHALAPLSFRAATYSGVFTLIPLLTGIGRERHGNILREIARIVDSGHLAPRLHSERFTLSDLGRAHDLITGRRARGKVVVDVG